MTKVRKAESVVEEVEVKRGQDREDDVTFEVPVLNNRDSSDEFNDEFVRKAEQMVATLTSKSLVAVDAVVKLINDLVEMHCTVMMRKKMEYLIKLESAQEERDEMSEEFTRERIRIEQEFEQYKKDKDLEISRILAEQLMESDEALRKLRDEKRRQEEEFNVLVIQSEQDFHRKEESMLKKLNESKDGARFDPPDSWFPFTDSEYKENNGMQIVLLDQYSDDFISVANEFNATCGSTHVMVSIERIQNPLLFRAYQFHRQEMEKNLKRIGFANEFEKFLFHGTHFDLKNVLASQSFDWRLNGKNGTAYGKGNYFASTASYSSSDTYSIPNRNGDKIMFFARVLVGRFAAGASNIPRPPAAQDGTLFDSVVNDIGNPTIFVVFDNWHAYPEYVITFRKR